jgi:hypothetical protein
MAAGNRKKKKRSIKKRRRSAAVGGADARSVRAGVGKKKGKTDRGRDSVSKDTWRKWAGREHHTITNQGQRYGIPALVGRVVHLPALALQFHNFLAANAYKLRAKDSETNGKPSLKEVKRDLAMLELDEKRGELIKREDADRRNEERLRWVVGMFDRATVELPMKLAPERSRFKREEMVRLYFNKLRDDAVARG